MERVDRPRLVDRRRPREGRPTSSAAAAPCASRRWPDAEDSPVKHFGEKEWRQVAVEIQNSLLSQFMHGEQGALLCTARIVETVPWIDAKYYAATQVMDEARHVEVFAALPRREARQPVRHQRQPEGHPRRHPRRPALGHRVPRHADHGRGARARRVRHDAPDHDRAAAEEAAALRDERRGAPRRVRRAVVAGVLQGAHRRGDARAPGVRVRRRRAGCSAGSRTPRCGRGWASTPTRSTARWIG